MESGFTRNYEEESVFWEINELMEARGFIMYEIFLNNVGRNNDQSAKGKRQPLWCQSIWLRDFIGQKEIPTYCTARLALHITQMMKYYDFAKELQDYFINIGLIEKNIIYFE